MKNLIVILAFIMFISYAIQKSSPPMIVEPETATYTGKVPEFRLRIAVMDTGLSPFQLEKPYMCKDKPFVNDENIAQFDKNGHGTNVVGLIGNAIDSTKYCITSYGIHNWGSIESYNNMLEKIGHDNPHAINLSWADEGYSAVEYGLLKEYSDKGIIIAVAAGNKAQHMTEDSCDMWPACHALKIKKNFYVIGSPNKRYSNYGDFVYAYYPGDKQGFPPHTGTSQSAANFTGKLFSK